MLTNFGDTERYQHPITKFPNDRHGLARQRYCEERALRLKAEEEERRMQGRSLRASQARKFVTGLLRKMLAWLPKVHRHGDTR